MKSEHDEKFDLLDFFKRGFAAAALSITLAFSPVVFDTGWGGSKIGTAHADGSEGGDGPGHGGGESGDGAGHGGNGDGDSGGDGDAGGHGGADGDAGGNGGGVGDNTQ